VPVNRCITMVLVVLRAALVLVAVHCVVRSSVCEHQSLAVSQKPRSKDTLRKIHDSLVDPWAPPGRELYNFTLVPAGLPAAGEVLTPVTLPRSAMRLARRRMLNMTTADEDCIGM